MDQKLKNWQDIQINSILTPSIIMFSYKGVITSINSN